MDFPKSFTLPGGYPVRIRFVTFAELQRLASSEMDPGDQVYAYYHDQSGHGTMYLVKGRHPLLLAADFQHELKHVIPEWEEWWMDQWGISALLDKAVGEPE